MGWTGDVTGSIWENIKDAIHDSDGPGNSRAVICFDGVLRDHVLDLRWDGVVYVQCTNLLDIFEDKLYIYIFIFSPVSHVVFVPLAPRIETGQSEPGCSV